MDLQPYKEFMSIKYKAGRLHQNADALSRAPLPSTNIASVVKVAPDFLTQVREGYNHDSEFIALLENLARGPDIPPHLSRFRLREDGIITFTGPNDEVPRICTPRHADLRIDLLHDHHDAMSAAHLGFPKTYNSLARRYFWNNMSRDARQYVRTCASCQRNKATTQAPTGLLQPLDIPPHRWHTITMDFAGPFHESGEGKWNMILVVVDKLTKRVHFVPAKNTDKAPDTAQRIFEAVV